MDNLFYCGLDGMLLSPPLAQKFCVLDNCLKHIVQSKSIAIPWTLTQAHLWGGIDRSIRDSTVPTNVHCSWPQQRKGQCASHPVLYITLLLRGSRSTRGQQKTVASFLIHNPSDVVTRTRGVKEAFSTSWTQSPYSHSFYSWCWYMDGMFEFQ